MNTHTLAGILVLSWATLNATAADGNSQPPPGGNAPKTNTDGNLSPEQIKAENEQLKQELKDNLNKNFHRAKESEKRLDKARKKLDELNKFKEYVNADTLKQAQDEFNAAQKEFDTAIDFVGIYGRWLGFSPTDDAKTAQDQFDVAFRAFVDPSDRLKDYLNKREADLKKAGKTDDEILDDYIHDPRVKEMEKEIDQYYNAFKKAEPKFHKAYFEALKKAEQQGKYVIEDKTNDKFKASPDPKSNEPQGGLKLGGNSYVPSDDSTNSPGLKTYFPLTNWNFGATGQIFTPTMPPIILPPYGGPGWEGSSSPFIIPGWQPALPGGTAAPQGGTGGCSCKPACTCKPVCHCKK